MAILRVRSVAFRSLVEKSNPTATIFFSLQNVESISETTRWREILFLPSSNFSGSFPFSLDILDCPGAESLA